MRRVLILMFLLPALLVARPAFAHGLGESQDLPLPLWLFLYGAAAAVLVSFVPIGLFADRRQTPPGGGYPSFDLFRVGPPRALLTARPLLAGLRLLSVALFLLVLLSGFFGQQNPGTNFAPTFVWISWWVGLTFFVAFVGNVWPLVNPWKVLFEWTNALVRRLDPKSDLESGVLPYPAALGVWPAVALYAAFIWIELVFEGSSVPMYVAYFALVYSFLTFSGMVLFGKDAWLRNGEAFSVFFGLVGRFAPTEVRVKRAQPREGCGAYEAADGCVNCYECFARAAPGDRELNLRPPGAGLGRVGPVSPGGVFFVVLVLAGVAYDGLLTTPLWSFRLRDLIPFAPETLGLVLLPLIFFALYLGFVKLSQLAGGGRLGLLSLAAAYVYSLVPIAIAYQVAHYYTYFLIQGQGIIRHVSDPFGWGWNLFGTGEYTVDASLVEMVSVWYSQVALIVAGHVIAVYLAHLVALKVFQDRRRALLSQLPMLALMILYTVFSLWILSQDEAYQVESVSPFAPAEEIRQPPMPDRPIPNTP